MGIWGLFFLVIDAINGVVTASRRRKNPNVCVITLNDKSNEVIFSDAVSVTTESGPNLLRHLA